MITTIRQEHPGNMHLLDAQCRQGPALLEAGPDRLPEPPDLSQSAFARARPPHIPLCFAAEWRFVSGLARLLKGD